MFSTVSSPKTMTNVPWLTLQVYNSNQGNCCRARSVRRFNFNAKYLTELTGGIVFNKNMKGIRGNSNANVSERLWILFMWENANRYIFWQLSLNFWKPPTSLENFILTLLYDAIISFTVQFVPQLFTEIVQFRKTKLAPFFLSKINHVGEEWETIFYLYERQYLYRYRPHRKLQ